MRHAGQVVTRAMLTRKCLGLPLRPADNVIDVHISRLRSKIEKGFDVPFATRCAAPFMLKAGKSETVRRRQGGLSVSPK